MQKFRVPDNAAKIFYTVMPNVFLVLRVGLPSYRSSGAYTFGVTSRFLENFCAHGLEVILIPVLKLHEYPELVQCC